MNFEPSSARRCSGRKSRADADRARRGAGSASRSRPSFIRLLWNLCDNAIRHGCAGSDAATIEVRAGRMLAADRGRSSRSADRGPGVSQPDLERIFEPFFTERPGRHGLGLFLARELAQTNGASLLYENRAGGGSLFRLVFADPTRWELR